MSEHTFRIWFSGLVHFVENRDPNAKCQLCVVLPRGDNDDAYRRHVGAIYAAEREIRCGKPRLKKGRKIIGLTRRRVSFEIQHFDDVQPQSDFQAFSSFGILNMRDIAGIFADENDQIVSVYPPEETVLAQILVGRGYYLDSDPLISVMREWRIPETLTGYPDYRILLADPVFVDIPHVKSVKMHYMSLDPDNREPEPTPEPPEPRSPVELVAGSSGMIEIFVANRCEGDHCLRAQDFEWRREPNKWTLMQLDRDFELNYRMLHPTTIDALERILSSSSGEVRYPVPESPFLYFGLAPHLCFQLPKEDQERINGALNLLTGSSLSSLGLQDLLDFIAKGTGTGSGSDCMGGRGEARFNALDQFIPDPELPPDRKLAQMRHQERMAKPALQVQPAGEFGSKVLVKGVPKEGAS